MPATSPTDAEPSLHGPPSAGWVELHLGTQVTIHSASERGADPRPAVARAFEEVGAIHRLMSFHEAASDVSRLNRNAAHGAVCVDERTVEVIRTALEVSRLSSGHFDITVAPTLVHDGLLPAPDGASPPDPTASWHDIQIVSDTSVYFRRPLWIDLGGIAKGYAVDRALQICRDENGPACMVNAGGDIRIGNGHTEIIALDVPEHDQRLRPQVELTDGAVASSGTGAGGRSAPHIDGRTGSTVDSNHFVSVLTERCIIADALTKVVLTMGYQARATLAAFDATALWHTQNADWRQLP